ncbi:MAG TPA: hypothetical protein VD793_01560, partial [Gemmatimonadales bacterium]|nr:hypothetical protein [Gemmatimonadales bacterium]
MNGYIVIHPYPTIERLQMSRAMTALCVSALVAIPALAAAQQDSNRVVAGGGITAQGWQGKPDAGSVNEAKLAQEGGALVVTTG